MYIRLARAWSVERILVMCVVYDFIQHRSVAGEFQHPSSKHRGSQAQYRDVLGKCYNSFDYMSVIYGHDLLSAYMVSSGKQR
jgi:hypothetical protein